MPTSPLFQRFVDEELALAPEFVRRVAAGTLQLLGPSSDGELSASERAHHGDLVSALQRHAQVYERSFCESLRRQVEEERAEADSARRTGDAEIDQPTPGIGTLELMDESRVEIDIEISRATQLIDSTAEWQLRELQTYTSTLLGQHHVTAESNPFRPLIYATALWDAASAISSAQIQRAIVLRTSAGVAAGLLKNAWAAASTRLEAQGVEPGTYRTVVLPSGGGFARQVAEPPRAGALAALLQSMPTAAEGGGRGVSVGGAGSGGAPGDPPRAVRIDGVNRRSAELEQALLRLDELLRQMPAEASLTGRTAPPGPRFEQHRNALVASAADPIDRQVIELVTRLFEAVLADSQLPMAFRPVLARMQVAALRVALAERSTLESFEHPVWRLIDRIGEVAAGYSRAEDPRLAGFLAFSRAVAEEMAGSTQPDTTLFRRGLNRADVFLAEQLQNQLRARGEAVAALQRAERQEVLQQHLGQRLTDQMVPVRTTPAIRRFVTGTWAQVIAGGMLLHGEQSDATMSNLKTVDDLLWSLKIPDHPQSRQRLLTMLPGLLQRIRAGMESIALAAAEQQIVLDELMAIHTEALRPGGRAGSASAALTPEEIVQRMRDEVVLETTPARLFADSVIDLSSMETVPAEHLPSGGDTGEDDPARRVETLRVGDRQRLFLHGRWSRVQLLWRSDRSLFFLFAGESPSRTHSITRRALERLAAAGLVQPLVVKPLIQRSVDRMMRELGPRP